jgi:hypothetical protein
VTIDTVPVITASSGGIVRTTSILIKAPWLTSVTLNPATVEGTVSSTGTVHISGPHPGGITILLSSSNPKAVVPASVQIHTGATSVNFTIKTSSVTSVTTSSIKATYSKVIKSATLSIHPVEPVSVTLNPNAVAGGGHSTATVKINGPAPSGGVNLAVTSSNSHATVPATVHVNTGASSATFTINTTTVTMFTNVKIKVAHSGVSQSVFLTVRPIAD